MTTIMRFLKDHKIEIAIFIVALVARSVYLGLEVQFHQGNLIGAIEGADGYYLISENIIHGNGFSSDALPPYTLNSFRLPVQPYFLAYTFQIFGTYWLPLVLLLFIGSFLPILAMRISRFLFDSRAISIGTGIILALEPVSILFSTFFYSETLFMLFFLLSMYYAFKYVQKEVWYDGVFAAIFLGIATLTKAVSMYLPILLVPLFLLHFRNDLTKKRVFAAGAFIAIFMLVLSPWLYRNYREFHSLSLTSEEGASLYTALTPSVLSIANGTSFQTEYKALVAKGMRGPNETTVDVNAQYVRTAIPILLAHPLALTIVSLNTTLGFFTHDGVYDVLKKVGARPDQTLGQPALFLLLSDPMKLLGFIGHFAMTPAILILVMRIAWFVATVFFFIGVALTLRRERYTFYTMTAFVSVLYFAAITLTIGLAVNARYRLPVAFFIIPFALYGFLRTKDFWYRHRGAK